MKFPVMAAVLALATAAPAQDMQSMPGMNMPTKPTSKTSTQQHAAPANEKRKPAHSKDQSIKGMKMDGQDGSSMSGMKMDGQNGSSMPKTNIGGQNDSSMPGMKMDGQSGSITRDTYKIQEPENPAQKTGSNLPAPNLLKDIVGKQPMSLSEFLALADKWNPTLAEANSLVTRSAAQARQAGAYPNPTIGYQGEEIRGGQYGGGQHGAFLQQPIVTAGKLGLRRNIYNQQKKSDQIGVEEQTYRVHGDVTNAFYTALTSQATVVVRQRLIGVAQDAVETVHQLANVGQADAPDILQAEVEAEQVKIDFEAAQRDFLQNFRTLAALSGRRDLPVAPLAGMLENPPELDPDKEVETVVNGSPTVRRMQQEIAIAEARLRDAKRESIPDLQLRVGEQYNFEAITEHPTKATGYETIASLGVTLPLWNRNQGNVATARSEIERSRQDVIREQLSLKQTAEPLAQAYATARFTAERYKTQLIPRAERAYQLYLKKYNDMAMAYPQVLVSQRILFQLQIDYLSALRNEWRNAIALQNFTLRGGLNAPTSTGSSSTAINIPNASAGSSE